MDTLTCRFKTFYIFFFVINSISATPKFYQANIILKRECVGRKNVVIITHLIIISQWHMQWLCLKYLSSSIFFSNPNILPRNKLELFYDGNVSDTKCYDFRPTQAMLYELNKVNAVAFVGFSCYCLTVAKVLSALNLPIISHVSFYFFGDFFCLFGWCVLGKRVI